MAGGLKEGARGEDRGLHGALGGREAGVATGIRKQLSEGSYR